MPADMLEILMSNLEVRRGEVYRVKGPLSLSRLIVCTRSTGPI